MVLFLDYDGVLHPDTVYRIGWRPELRGPGQLMMWVPVLEAALAPHPQVRIVLSTACVAGFNALGREKQGLCRDAALGMNDYHLVRYKRRKLQPNDTQQWHFSERRWLTERLDQPFDGPTVVITHHAPSNRSQHPRFPLGEVSASFQSDLEALMGGDRVALWIHGHTHACVDYEVSGTRVLANQQGYPNEPMPGYREARVVEVARPRPAPALDGGPAP